VRVRRVHFKVNAMRHLFFSLVFPISFFTLVACDGDDDVAPKLNRDAGAFDSGPGPDSASTLDANPPDAASSDAGPRPAAAFLAQSDYAALISLSASFPFGVTQVHASTKEVAPANWGRHGGPLVTTGGYTASGAVINGYRYAFGADPKAAATSTTVPFAKPANLLPGPAFFGGEGIVDLSSALSLHSYTSTGANSEGEFLILDTGLGVKSRAFVNGAYDAKALPIGASTYVVYTGLSRVSASASATNDSGLYLSQLCGDTLVASGTCKSGFPLLKWPGFSGPVVTDARGNVFTAASFASKNDSIYALPKSAIATALTVFENTPFTNAPIAEGSQGGSSAFAAVAPEASAPGWILYREGDYNLPLAATKAVPYLETASSIQKATTPEIANAIVMGPDASDLYYFTDAEGDLWIAVTKTGGGGAFIELRRK
jgi:hypothetical protein